MRYVMGLFLIALAALWFFSQRNAEVEKGPKTPDEEVVPRERDLGPDILRPAAEPSRDHLVRSLERLLRDLAKSTQAPALEALAERIEEIFEEELLGRAGERSAYATSLAREILEAFRAQGPGTAPDALRTQAQHTLARQLASEARVHFVIVRPGQRHEGSALRVLADPKVPEGYVRAAWPTLAGFAYADGQPLPQEVLALKGQRVALVGYMISLDGVRTVRRFLLVASRWSCCFGAPPGVNQVVVAKTQDGKETPFVTAPVLALGALDIGAHKDEGFVTSLYRLTVEAVHKIQ